MNAGKFLLIFITILVPSLCLAHGMAFSQQKIVDQYMIEFENDFSNDVLADRFTLYTFRLLDSETRKDSPFDVAFAKIKRTDGTPVLSGYQYPMQQMGSMGASLGGIISEPGNYIADITFDKGVKQVASTSFEFIVVPSTATKSESPASKILLLTIAAIAGTILGLLINRHKRRGKIS